MKHIVLGVLAVTLIAGCAGSADLVRQAGTGERIDVFSVISTTKPPEKGYADLTIRASLKTHRTAAYPLGNDTHGTSDYRLIINIDGQSAHLLGAQWPEGDSSRPSEDGDGVRYLFRAHLRLKTGLHRVVIALPGDNVAVDRGVRLEDGTDNLLEIAPEYYTDRRMRGRRASGATSFTEGIARLGLALNGVAL